MPLKPELLTDLFERAAAAEIGIAIDTNNTKLLEVKLHEHRAICKLWDDLMVVRPSTPDQLFIMHKTVELD